MSEEFAEKEEINLSNFVNKFLIQANTEDMTFAKYPKKLFELDIKVSFGQGNPAKIPWISFTAPGMSTSKGYYPVYLFYKEQKKLVLAYGLSESEGYEKTWPEEVFMQNKKIKDVLEGAYRYGDSYVYKIYDVEKNSSLSIDGENINNKNFIDDLENLLNYYKKNIDFELIEPSKNSKSYEDTIAFQLQGKNKSYSSTPLPIMATIGKIKSGEIQIPEMQREYVWETSKVRDLFDSLYRGYPIGYILLWDVKEKTDINKSIGTNLKSHEVSQYVIDGQQRLTSLYAVATGTPVVNENFKQITIKIDFNPFTEIFETSTPATEKDPEFFHDITGLFNISQQFELINAFKENYELRIGRKLTQIESQQINTTLSRVAGIMNVELQLLTLSDDMDIATASDVFVRINSKQADLSQADFILTLLSVRWPEGKREVQKFSKETKVPPENKNDITSYNRLIEVDSSMMIYPISMLAFNRTVLKFVYPLLAEDGEESSNLSIWQEAQRKALDRNNWQSYINIVMSAGFIFDKLITQPNAFVYIYGIYLLGLELKVERTELERTLAAYFFMATLSRRYSSGAEAKAQEDIQLIKENNEKGISFIETLEEIIRISFTKDFFEIQLESELRTSGAWNYSSWSCYVASQVVLGAPALYTNMKLADLLDRERSGSRQLLELHHLFPKNYLKKELGLKSVKEYNQRANFQLVTSKVNMEILDSPPYKYHKEYLDKISGTKVKEMLRLNALWEGWDKEEYFDFLEKRRKLIVKIIQDGWAEVSQGKISVSKLLIEEKKHTVRPQDESTEDIVVKNKVESRNLELKETFMYDVELNEDENLKQNINEDGIKKRKNDIIHSSLKTIAGFLNSDGGTLLIGISDYWEVFGIDRDLAEMQNGNLDTFQQLLTQKIENSFSSSLNNKDIDISFPEIDNKTIVRLDVERSSEPIFVNKEDNNIFYVREIGKTNVYEAERLASYLITHFR